MLNVPNPITAATRARYQCSVYAHNSELERRAKWERVKGLRENRETHDAGTKSTILCVCVCSVGLRRMLLSSFDV